MPNFKVEFRNRDSGWISDVVNVVDVAAKDAVDKALDAIRDKYLAAYAGNPAQAEAEADTHVALMRNHVAAVSDSDTGHGATQDDLDGKNDKTKKADSDSDNDPAQSAGSKSASSNPATAGK